MEKVTANSPKVKKISAGVTFHPAAGRDGGRVVTYDVALVDVLCVEIGEALLCCWMRVVFGRAVCEEVEIPFNLVRAALFRKVLSLIRRR
jgi:hypothetical protein